MKHEIIIVSKDNALEIVNVIEAGMCKVMISGPTYKELRQFCQRLKNEYGNKEPEWATSQK